MSPEMMLAKMLATAQREVEKTASVEETEDLSAIDKLAWAEETGRELAREHMEKVAVTLPSMAGIQKGIGSAMHATMGASKGMRAGVGAAGGAVLGGAAGAMKDPGVNQQTGQKNSRLGNIAGGMALGGAGGAALGVGAKRGLQMVAGSKGAVGQHTRAAMFAGAGNTKDLMRTKGLNTLANKGLNPNSAAAKAQAGMGLTPGGGAPAKAPAKVPAQAPALTAEQARDQSKGGLRGFVDDLRGKPRSDARTQAMAQHKTNISSVVDPAALYKLMLERTGRG